LSRGTAVSERVIPDKAEAFENCSEDEIKPAFEESVQ
jgi:hypothetical protein